MNISLIFILSIFFAFVSANQTTVRPPINNCEPQCNNQQNAEILWPHCDPTKFYQCKPVEPGIWEPWVMPCNHPKTLFSFAHQVCVWQADFIPSCADCRGVEPTGLPTSSVEPTGIPTGSETQSPAPTFSPTPSVAPTGSQTPAPTISPTPSVAPTGSQTQSPGPTFSPTPSVAPTGSETQSPAPTISPTPSVAPTGSQTHTPTPTISPTPSVAPTGSETQSPAPTVPTPTPTSPPVTEDFCGEPIVCSTGNLLTLFSSANDHMYYRCELIVNPEGGIWNPIRHTCPSNLLFSFEKQKCVIESEWTKHFCFNEIPDWCDENAQNDSKPDCSLTGNLLTLFPSKDKDKYYCCEMTVNPEGGKWSPVLVQCPKNQIFSFKDQKCIDSALKNPTCKGQISDYNFPDENPKKYWSCKKENNWVPVQENCPAGELYIYYIGRCDADVCKYKDICYELRPNQIQ